MSIGQGREGAEGIHGVVAVLGDQLVIVGCFWIEVGQNEPVLAGLLYRIRGKLVSSHRAAVVDLGGREVVGLPRKRHFGTGDFLHRYIKYPARVGNKDDFAELVYSQSNPLPGGNPPLVDT